MFFEIYLPFFARIDVSAAIFFVHSSFLALLSALVISTSTGALSRYPLSSWSPASAGMRLSGTSLISQNRSWSLS